MVVCACHPSKNGKCEIGDLGKKRDPISKMTRAKRAEGTAQVMEHLLSKPEVLEFKPQYCKNKKEIILYPDILNIMCRTQSSYYLGHHYNTVVSSLARTSQN
jgi:hypothetical protein